MLQYGNGISSCIGCDQQLFEVLGGWQIVVDGTVTAEQFYAFIHHDQSCVAFFLYDCSQCGGLTHCQTLVHRLCRG
jgi:hypothetical protein